MENEGSVKGRNEAEEEYASTDAKADEIGLFVGYLETYCRGNCLESMKVILMRIPSNGGYVVSSGHILLPGGVLSGETVLHSIEFLANGVPLETPNFWL